MLKFDEQVAHPSLARSVGLLGPFVPQLPLIPLVEVDHLRRVVVEVHVRDVLRFSVQGRGPPHESLHTFGIAAVVRSPSTDVVAAEQTNGGQRGAGGGVGVVAITVSRFPRALGGMIEERVGLLDNLAVYDDVAAQDRCLQSLNLPADD